MEKGKMRNIVLFISFLVFVGISYLIDYENGQKAGIAFVGVLTEMLKILPCAFILIGLFEVWVKKETVMKREITITFQYDMATGKVITSPQSGELSGCEPPPGWPITRIY